MLGIEPSTFVSKIDILTTTPIVHMCPWCTVGQDYTVLQSTLHDQSYECATVGFYMRQSLVEPPVECVSVHVHDAPDTRLVHYT